MREKQSMSQPNAALSFAHRDNIERYRRILRTYLTEIERIFVQRRLAEEQAALERLASKARPSANSSFAALKGNLTPALPSSRAQPTPTATGKGELGLKRGPWADFAQG